MHCINELGSSLYNIACVWIKSFTLPWKKFSKHFKVNINPIWLFFYARRIVEHKKEKFFHNYEKSSKIYIEIHVLTNLFTYLISHNVSSKHNFRSCIFLYLILSPGPLPLYTCGSWLYMYEKLFYTNFTNYSLYILLCKKIHKHPIVVPFRTHGFSIDNTIIMKEGYPRAFYNYYSKTRLQQS